MSPSDDFRAFADQAAQLEAHIADVEARGEPVPPEAWAILESLRALARAVDDLRASLDGSEPPLPGAPPDPSE